MTSVQISCSVEPTFDDNQPRNGMLAHESGADEANGFFLHRQRLFRIISICLNLLLFVQICILLINIINLPRFFAHLADIPNEIQDDLQSLPMFSTLRILVLRCLGLSMLSFCFSLLSGECSRTQ